MNVEVIIPAVFGTVLLALLVGFIVYFIVLYRKSQIKNLVEQERLNHALLHAELEIQEQTLVNISRELHDNLGQVASLLKINLNLLKPESTNEQLLKINQSLELNQRLIEDIKALSKSLNGERIQKLGLVSMMLFEVERINQMGVLHIETNIPVKLQTRLSRQSKVILFRVFQEALNNTLKHAKATTAILKITEHKGRLTLSFEDDGVGFDTNENHLEGAGLNNMKKRCAMIGGTFHLTSRLKNGTTITIEIPTDNEYKKV